MRSISIRAVLLLLIGLAFLSALPSLGQTPAAPARTNPLPELKKLHVLLAIDTSSALADSVDVDRHNMETVLRKHIPRERLELAVLQGEQLTRDAILRHYRNLKYGSEDGVLFFYAGHGKIDEMKQPYFAPQCAQGAHDHAGRGAASHGGEETRTHRHSERLLQHREAGENHARVPPKQRALAPEAATPHPVSRCLFFQHRGIVDITAAQEGTASFGHFRRGGIFTQALVKVLDSDFKDLDLNKDHFVSWKEFAEVLTRKTEDLFDQLCEQTRERLKWDIKKEQKTQRPHIYSLAEQGVGPQTFAVVSLVNRTGTPMRLRYRWSSMKEWQELRLEKDGKRVLDLAIKPDVEDSALPRLEIEPIGERGGTRISARKWSGSGKPQYKDGREFEILAE